MQALRDVRGNQRVTTKNPEATHEALEKYGRDLTQAASAGKLDPVIGRDERANRLTLSGICRAAFNNLNRFRQFFLNAECQLILTLRHTEYIAVGWWAIRLCGWRTRRQVQSRNTWDSLILGKRPPPSAAIGARRHECLPQEFRRVVWDRQLVRATGPWCVY